MRIFAVLGSAPTAPDRAAVIDAGQTDLLLSFFDYPRAFESLLAVQNGLIARHASLNQPTNAPKEQS